MSAPSHIEYINRKTGRRYRIVTRRGTIVYLREFDTNEQATVKKSNLSKSFKRERVWDLTESMKRLVAPPSEQVYRSGLPAGTPLVEPSDAMRDLERAVEESKLNPVCDHGYRRENCARCSPIPRPPRDTYGPDPESWLISGNTFSGTTAGGFPVREFPVVTKGWTADGVPAVWRQTSAAAALQSTPPEGFYLTKPDTTSGDAPRSQAVDPLSERTARPVPSAAEPASSGDTFWTWPYMLAVVLFVLACIGCLIYALGAN